MADVLIHIGYPKAGSSYLQDWFSKHPSFLYKFNSVAGFNNLHELASYAQTTNRVHECFVASSEDLTVWKGNIDIVGLKYVPYDIVGYQKKACQVLFKIFPSAKVLIITRGFESMLKSIYSESVLAGCIQTFEEFQEENGNILSLFYDYNFVIGLYRQAFKKENVITLPYELLRENPEEFLRMIEDVVGIKERFAFSTEKVNPSLSANLMNTYRKISKMLYKMVQPFPYSLQKAIYGFYVYQLYRTKPHPLIKLVSKSGGENEVLSVTEKTLQLFTSKAELLKAEKLYEPYLKEYLL